MRASAGALVTSTAQIGDGVIIDADINASAAIALSKLASDPVARANHTGTQTKSTVSDYPAAASQAEAEAGTETAAREFSPQRVKQAIDALQVSGEAKMVFLPGMGRLSTATLVETGSFSGAIEMADGTPASWRVQGIIPLAANGLAISKIEVIINNKDAGAAKNITFLVGAEHWAYADGGTKTIDDTRTSREYATSGNGDDTTDIIALNADIWNALPATFNTNEVIALEILRSGNDVNDTYAVALQILAVVITFA